jgi:hypothetical protein
MQKPAGANCRLVSILRLREPCLHHNSMVCLTAWLVNVPGASMLLASWSWSDTLAAIFGIVNVIQFVVWLLERKAHRANIAHLEALKESMIIQRARCTEAITFEEVLKTDQAKDFARQMGYALLGFEGHIDAILTTLGKPVAKTTGTIATPGLRLSRPGTVQA